MSEPKHVLPQDDARRKAAPMCRGLLDYFPAALFAVAAHSLVSDVKHNGPSEGRDPTWARGKSTDHADCCVRHLAERGTDPAYHLRAHAWRALALLQEYLEQHEGAAPGLASRFPPGPEGPRIEYALAEDGEIRPRFLPADRTERVLERLSDKATMPFSRSRV